MYDIAGACRFIHWNAFPFILFSLSVIASNVNTIIFMDTEKQAIME